MDARPFDTIHGISQSLSFVQSLFKHRNAPIWRIGNKGQSTLQRKYCGRFFGRAKNHTIDGGDSSLESIYIYLAPSIRF